MSWGDLGKYMLLLTLFAFLVLVVGSTLIGIWKDAENELEEKHQERLAKQRLGL